MKTFEAEDTDREILIIGNEKLFHTIRSAIKGEEIPVAQIVDYTNTDAVLELYDIPPATLTETSLLNAVISRISSKEYANT